MDRMDRVDVAAGAGRAVRALEGRVLAALNEELGRVVEAVGEGEGAAGVGAGRVARALEEAEVLAEALVDASARLRGSVVGVLREVEAAGGAEEVLALRARVRALEGLLAEEQRRHAGAIAVAQRLNAECEGYSRAVNAVLAEARVEVSGLRLEARIGKLLDLARRGAALDGRGD